MFQDSILNLGNNLVEFQMFKVRKFDENIEKEFNKYLVFYGHGIKLKF